jgi:hypothetical protein
VRLCKAARYRYANNDMADLEAQLKAASEKKHRFKIIVTDGVFSMDGIVADLKGVCDLADKYDALVMVDECHAAGFIGRTGRGSVEHCGVMGRVDIITGTLGKALGGAMGGYTTGRKEIIEMLRQRSRPYLFSNSLAPAIVGASIKVIDLLSASTELRDRLERNVTRFRTGIVALGFKTRGAGAAIVPVMLGDAKLSQVMADKLLGEKTFAQLSDDELFWQHNTDTNSVATIVKHLWGNMRSRWTDFLTTDGEKPWREREAEFENDVRTREAMLAKWEEGWACLFGALEPLTDADLGRIIHIRNEGHTVLEAINRQLAHYPYHVGQIVHIGKMLRGDAWQSLSIPRGGSMAFNADKFSKPKHRGHFTDGVLAHAHTIPLLREELREAHEGLWATVNALPVERLAAAPPGKWSALQHMVHIHLGVKAMAGYLALPKEVIAEKFGRMERPSMDMDALTKKYSERLAQGVVPPDRFTPLPAKADGRAALLSDGQEQLRHLLDALGSWSEPDLDGLMCPHPAMGPLTAREMVMFTVLHARHHARSIERTEA